MHTDTLLTAALTRFAGTITAGYPGARFTCGEVEAILPVLVAADHREAARTLLVTHAMRDASVDLHHLPGGVRRDRALFKAWSSREIDAYGPDLSLPDALAYLADRVMVPEYPSWALSCPQADAFAAVLGHAGHTEAGVHLLECHALDMAEPRQPCTHWFAIHDDDTLRTAAATSHLASL